MRLLFVCLLFAASLRAFAAGPPEKWDPAARPWDGSLGTHRVVLKVGEMPAHTKGVAAFMEWRRPDKEPEKKAVLVYDLKTGKQVTNVDVVSVTNEEGVIIFEPVSGPGEYAVYFLPVKIEGGAFPVSKYTPPQQTAAEAWLKEQAAAKEKPQAEVARWEAISAHDAWTEMEVIATESEANRLMREWSDSVAIIVPPRGQSVRIDDRLSKLLTTCGELDIPWMGGNRPNGLTRFEALPGERLTFQVIPWSPKWDLKNVRIQFEELQWRSDWRLDPKSIHCLTTDRTDWNGKASQAQLDVPRGSVRPLWFEVEIPNKTGLAAISVSLFEGESQPTTGHVALLINVSGTPVADHGDADPQSLSRLRWLNSTTAVDDEPVKGYEPLTVKGRTIRCLGRELELGEDGLPVQIRSYFNKAVTKVMDTPQVEMLLMPMQFFMGKPGWPTEFWGKDFKFTSIHPGFVEWEADVIGAMPVKAKLKGLMEFDGSVHYRVALEATTKELRNEWFRLSIELNPKSAEFILGLQNESGRAPDELTWQWDSANKHQDSVWLGAVNGGLRLQLKADNYVRPGVNIHYKRRPLNDPPSWNANGKGSIFARRFKNEGSSPVHYLLAADSYAVTLQPGKPLHFDFDLLITPFHTLRTKEQWSDRYYHTGGVPQDYAKYLDGAKAAGANIVNVHQGNWLNPYINYPFLTADKLGAFAKAAHDRGMRAKYYYTVRELSNWCPELFAFRSMGDEILMSGKGGGHPWGEEHLGGNYWQAWYEPGVQDVSFLTQPMSRFHNYYIEGLRWLCENAGCDGIYLDDIAYDRSIMLRARKVLDRYCPRGGLIDLHSWNEFHEGGAWAHCANIFMDSFPFVDRIWFGEGHHYTGPPPEHFLVELSGIPFGLMGEMLEGGGNPWFGLVHGMTGRLGWQGNPTGVWKLWDEFGVQDADFIGWWAEDECPVRCADPLVKATVWKKADATMVAVANFSKEPKQAALEIDWKALGRDPAKAKLYFPAMTVPKQRAALREVRAEERGAELRSANAERGTEFRATFPLQPYAGAVFIIDEKPHDIAAPAAEALGTIILDEDFTRGLDKSWKPVISPRAKDAGKLDAGYVLQMPANLHGYLERALPAEAAAASARIWQDGNDQGQQWGPGLAVVWPDGKTLRANVRHDGRLTVSANGSEDFPASITARAPVEFTIRWDKDSVKVIAAGPGMGDLPEEIASFPRIQFPGLPSLLRAGKMPNSTGPQDFGEAGAVGFNRIEWVRVFSRQPSAH